ncbi:hypothetical protein C488_04257 [Natrinema pellirubrum DSM 15624]|uniref:Halobacterial output domain-containing protein n=1 Tax=Natrinema pellirubrum (strain DSM 15624 / CIP 106293 / JCM 10476 / NCIMB 786 / 157) TaxID=797303 RepID=L0JGL5_NATP1|nr:HalOD1 output domain-containing protein [Natrinema pellirubrum]AGB30439.1 hypothetical protein Natpe_0510 [Natrinema pellirubrum DSM 15624]ELY79755.1 hypothetical protein C488_04257 [Natrinema pellirubrum DSM 15624]
MQSLETTAVSLSEGEQLSMAVIDLVSRLEDADPTALEPLYDAIDPDLLDSLPDAAGFESLVFDYHGYSIRATADDEGVRVALEDSAAPERGR